MVNEMAEDVNEKIINKIKKSKVDKEIKDFLKKILVIELENFEEGRPRYSDKYDREIVNCASKFEVKGE